MPKLNKQYIFILIFHYAGSLAWSQQLNTDSLWQLIKTGKNDSSKVNVLNTFAKEFRNSNPDSSIYFAKNAINLSQKINFIKGKAEAYLWYGTAKTTIGNYDEAIFLLNKSVNLFSREPKGKLSLLENQLLGRALNNLSNVYWYKGSFLEALKFQFRSLKIKEKINDQYGIAASYHNIGNIFSERGDYVKAIKNYYASIKIKEKIKDSKGLADTYTNIGLVYNEQLEYVKALKAFTKALEIYKKINDNYAIGIVLNNIGTFYHTQNMLDEAKNFLTKSLKMKEMVNDQYGIALTLNNLGTIELRFKKFTAAKNYFKRALEISMELGIKNEITDSYYYLSQVDSAENKYMLALQHYKLYIVYKDSIFNEESTKKQTQIEMQYEFDKQLTADSIKTAVRANHENLKYNQEMKQQKIYTYGGIAAFCLMLVVAIVSIRAFRNKHKTNTIIQEQKHIVEEKQKEVMDSIKYASRIQRALLPSKSYIQNSLKKLNQI